MRIQFSAPMDQQEVAEHFAVNPHVDGTLAWRGTTLVFTPAEALDAGARYAVICSASIKASLGRFQHLSELLLELGDLVAEPSG